MMYLALRPNWWKLSTDELITYIDQQQRILDCMTGRDGEPWTYYQRLQAARLAVLRAEVYRRKENWLAARWNVNV